MKSALNVPTSLCVLALVTLPAWYGPPAASPPVAAPLAGAPTPIGAVPFTINTPGSYCLTNNVTGQSGETGIRINADNVVLDLGGFVLEGLPGSVFAVTGMNEYVTVKNGTIHGWGNGGVDLGDKANVHDLSIHDIGGRGIQVDRWSTIRNCVVARTASEGINLPEISAQYGSSVIDCRVDGEFSNEGIDLGPNCLAERVLVTGTDQAFNSGRSCTFVDCTALNFRVTGFDVDDGSSLVNCSLFGTLGPEPYAEIGIKGADGIRIESCTVSERVLVGIEVGDFCIIEKSIVRETEHDGVRCGVGGQILNSTVVNSGQNRANGGAGIRAGRGTRIVGSVMAGNAGSGLYTPEGEPALVQGCVSMDNVGVGLYLQGPSWARDNWVLGNTDAGIRATGGSHFIEGNNAPKNLNGIVVTGTSSLLAGNRAVGNTATDFVVAPGNPMGPILYGGGQISTSNPQANFKTLYP